MNRPGILVIEHDEELSQTLAAALTDAGYEPVVCSNPTEAVSTIYETRPALIIMADELSTVTGRQLLSGLRQLSSRPIIVIGNADEVADAEMLEQGADAYVAKPPSIAELIARVQSLLRRSKPPLRRGGTPRGGLDDEADEDKGDGSGDFSASEFRLLACLALSDGQVVPHRRLLAEVWGENKVSSSCLKVCLWRLRQKLSRNFAPCHIVSCRGLGYRLEAVPIR